MDNKMTNTVSASDVVAFLRRHIRTIIAFGALSAFCIALATFLMQPIYRSTATLLIDSRQSNVLDSTAILSGITSDSAVVDSQVEIIRSPLLLARVAEKEKLYNREDFYKPSQSVLTILGVVLGIHAPLDTLDAKTVSESPSLIGDWLKIVFPAPLPTTEEAIKTRVIEQLQTNLMVSREGKSLVLSVSYDSSNAELAAKIVNRVTTEYLNDQLETKLEATKRATSWLTDRLSGLRKELDAKESTIAAFKQQNNLFGASGVTQIEQQVTRLNEQLITAKVETAEKLARFNQVQSLARSGSLQSYSGFVSSSTVSNLRVQESEALGDVANLAGKYGDNHPQLINAKAKLRDVRKQINDEANRMVDNARSEYTIAQSREASLRASLGGLKGQFDATGTKSIQLQKLEREAETARMAYNAISERFRETDKSDKIQESDARIISPATITLDPVKPKKALLTIVAFIFGVLIGGVVAALRDALVKGYLKAEQLQQDTGIMVLSSVMRLGTKELKIQDKTIDVHRYIVQKPLSAFAEALRRIRVGVEASENLKNLTQTQHRKNNIVMITSSVPSEGKTTISTSYALSAAQSGKRVALIDSDFRRPALTKLLHKDIQFGLAEYLKQDIPLSDVIYKTEFEGLDFIGIKECPNYPTDLLKTDKCAALFSYLKENYDLVLVDTPPLAAVIDGRVIAEFVDDIVYVTAWEATPRKIVLESLNVLPETLKNKIVGLVLNKIDAAKDRQYGDEYGYGYSLKKYASYYES
jgi:polysaccharide biosynthesis transport protein